MEGRLLRVSFDAEAAADRREAWRRAQLPHDLRVRRRISRELDLFAGGSAVNDIQLNEVELAELRAPLRVYRARKTLQDGGDFYREVGLTMGMAERREAGIALLRRAAA